MHYKYERIPHINDLPLNIFVASIGSIFTHWHKELEILFILEGSLEIFVGEEKKRFELKAHDVFLINSYDVHGFDNASENNICLIMQVDMSYAVKYFKNIDKIQFNANLLTDNVKLSDIFRENMANLFFYLRSKHKNRYLMVMSILNFLVGCIVETYESELNSSKQSNFTDVDRNRIIHIIDYINNHYTEKITLHEIAEAEHLNKFYLAHYIKERVGITFHELINEIRLDKALDMLIKTDRTVLDIAIDCGFSETKYFNKLVKDKFGCSARSFKEMYNKSERPPLSNVIVNDNQRSTFDMNKAVEILSNYGTTID